MKRINLDNYESYVLDFLEGRLDNDLTEELKSFSILHPELEIDLDSSLPELNGNTVIFPDKQQLHREFNKDEELILLYIENLLTKKEKSEFEEKLHRDPSFNKAFLAFEKTKLTSDPGLLAPGILKLHKTEEDFFLNNRVLNYLESEMSAEDAQNFNKELLSDPDLNKEYTAFAKTRVPVEYELVFPNKISLYKKNKVIGLFSLRTYYSAAAVILMLIALVPLIRIMIPEHTQEGNQQSSLRQTENPGSFPKIDPIKGSSSATQKKVDVVVMPEQTIKSIARTENKQVKLTPEEESKSQANLKDTLMNKLPIVDQTFHEQPAIVSTSNTPTEEEYVKLDFSHMIPFEEDDEETINAEQQATGGFWHKATRLARKVNKLGIKSVDGNEVDHNHYLISFNAMLIEKK